MSSILSNYSGNLALAAVLKGTLYLAAHLDAPPVATGSDTHEVAGGGYIRQVITFSSAASKSVVSTNRVQFSGMPACTVQYFAVWDQISDGHLLAIIPLVFSIVVAESQALIAEVGDIGLVL